MSGLPGEAGPLDVAADLVTLSWAPGSAGGTAVLNDTLRSELASDFLDAGTCVESGGSDLVTLDVAMPAPGGILHYLVWAHNACGVGPLQPVPAGRAGPLCP